MDTRQAWLTFHYCHPWILRSSPKASLTSHPYDARLPGPCWHVRSSRGISQDRSLLHDTRHTTPQHGSCDIAFHKARTRALLRNCIDSGHQAVTFSSAAGPQGKQHLAAGANTRQPIGTSAATLHHDLLQLREAPNTASSDE